MTPMRRPAWKPRSAIIDVTLSVKLSKEYPGATKSFDGSPLQKYRFNSASFATSAFGGALGSGGGGSGTGGGGGDGAGG
eukprot:CAMPEP_0119319250 /NCGR_PEP_ID=MMETSP1333-20130426/48890_1 /TAXON_ID=418940 /ORGANISM="Scyphosphaera apsteinii, Strain RCC1455" /LENGTH=78 /DNA_ID=CAMNT_0007325613 /DNA_START=300 /DNA_END=533 /DNA_ORIENTATION=-